MPLSKIKIKKAQTEGDGPDASTAAKQKRESQKKEYVLKKLKKAEQLDLSAEQQEQMALNLSSEAKMKEEYFGDLLKSAREAVEEVRKEKEEHKGGIRNRQEQQVCMIGIAKEAYQVKTIEVQLAFRTLRTSRWQRIAELIHRYVKNFEYGAFHAAIIIGDTVLEWNDSSLVIPQRLSDTEWAFRNSVHTYEAGSMTAELGSPVPLRATDEETEKHFHCIIEKIEGIRKEKELLVEALVEVAVRYNTKFHYGIISNNCQHFVKDCLEVLGTPNEKFPFSQRVKELADKLVRGGQNTMSDDFATHEELSSYVAANLPQMTVPDIEYCLCLYHLFHAFQGNPKCSNATCRASQLEEELEKRRTIER